MDFGAGEGALSQRLADQNYEVFSVDIDKNNFKAKTTFLQLDFNKSNDIQNFINENIEKYDLVLGIEVIEHVENPWEYLRNLKRMVKPGGYILISTPNITSWYSRLNFLLRGRFHQFEDHDRDYGHINPIALDELLYIAKNLDLNTVKASPGRFLPRLWLFPSFKGMILNVIGFLSSFFMRGIKNGWCLISLFRKD